MELTVVIASIDAERTIESCIQHVNRSCAGLATEILVVDASSDNTVTRIPAVDTPLTVLTRPAGTLAPQLWAEGYRRASGRTVAFTTGHCLVSLNWARTLLDAINGGATGAGGPLVIAPGSRPLDWAVYYLRYSGSMPHSLGCGRIAGDIAGDNAAYLRAALDQHAATFSQGFWEVDFHRRVRADGGWLEAVPAATVEFARSFPFTTIFRQRFSHGRHSGTMRVSGGSRTRLQVALATPLVPFVLAIRAGRRAAGGPAPWKFVLALPWFLLLASSWAVGEARGALDSHGAKAGFPY